MLLDMTAGEVVAGYFRSVRDPGVTAVRSVGQAGASGEGGCHSPRHAGACQAFTHLRPTGRMPC